jgi:teichuronic acid biosynthesis glycosyltransferase TuaH
VVAFPFHDQRKSDVEGVRTRDGHLLAQLDRSESVRTILTVDRPLSVAELLVRRRPIRARGDLIARTRIGSWGATLTQATSGTFVLDTLVPDLVSVAQRRRGWWFDSFARQNASDAVDWAASRAGIESPHVIAWTPTVVAPVEAVRPTSFVFDSLDNWLIHPVLRRNAREAEKAYARLLPLATAVVASAPASARELSRWVQNVQVIPNGVDLERFRTAVARPADVPTAPVVGYVGKLARRVDVELISEVAATMPDVTFVFIGPALDHSVHRLRAIKNVCLLGDRSPDEIPAYLRTFDVAWIPHRVGTGETGGDPIKLYEYWAAGRQVVTTPIDGWEAWTDRAFVVRSAGDARAAIRGLLDLTVPEKRVWVDRSRTWGAIANEILALLLSAPRASPGPSGA